MNSYMMPQPSYLQYQSNAGWGNTLSSTGNLGQTGMQLGGGYGAIAGIGAGLSLGLGQQYNKTKFGQSTLGKVAAFGINPMFGTANLLANKKRKKYEEEKAKYEQQMFEYGNNVLEEQSKGVLANYNTQGNMRDSFAHGGTIPYLTNGGQIDLGDGMSLFKGPKHEGGGIGVDTNADFIADAEVEGEEVYEDRGSRIYSDRLKPDEATLDQIYNETGIKVSGTYADVAKKLGKAKGQESTGTAISDKTNEITTQRVESGLDLLFNTQEASKQFDDMNQYSRGGKMKGRPTTKKPTGKGVYAYGGYIEYLNDSNDGNKKNSNQPLSYKVMNPDGSYTLVEIPAESFTSNVPPTKTEIDAPMKQGVDTDMEPIGAPPVTREGINSLPSMRKVKKVPFFNSNTRNVTNRKFFATGGNMKKYYNGGVGVGFNGVAKSSFNNPIGMNYDPFLNTDISTGLYNPTSMVTNMSAPSGAAPSGGMSMPSDTAIMGLGQLANLGSYLQNKKQINNMQINRTPYLSPTPRYSYRDTSGNDRRMIRRSTRRAIDSVSPSVGNTNATYAQLKAAELNALNDVNAQEGQRRLQYDQNYNFQLGRNNMINAGQINQARADNLDLFNDRIALNISNMQQFQQGVTGNLQAYQNQKADRMRQLIAFYGQGYTGVGDRLPENFRNYYGLPN